MENYQNLVGKLLAGENLTIVQKRMDTAAFDIKTRTLYLPIWKDMTPEINDMLICHEVSHALFTPMDYVDALDKKLKFKNAGSYLNILEDVRAEKLIKRKYPGIKKSFSLGYKQLNEKDFFGAKKKDLSKSHLMDRINLFYKVGYDCGVTFTEAEKVFVDRAGNTESIQEVIQLAEDIFKFIRASKEAEKEQPNQPEKNNDKKEKKENQERTSASDKSSDDQEESENPESQSSESDSDEDSESDSDEENDVDSEKSEESETEDNEESSNDSSESENSEESEDNEESSENLSEEQDEASGGSGGSGAGRDFGEDESFDDGEITTESSFSENSKDLINYSEEREYLDISEDSKEKIVPFKLILESYDDELHPVQKNYIDEFKKNANQTVSYMVKEFEMKKAAEAYKNNTTAKSGLLDIKKLYAYQIKDDLFKKLSITKDGKNHGMVVLLDWSGSMQDCMKNALEQTITLAMFCKRINIPFRVFAFADGYPPADWKKYFESSGSLNKSEISYRRTYWGLLEFFSDQMGNADMNKMMNFLLSGRIHSTIALNGTPLTESLLFMYTYMSKFRRSNNVEKLSLITITDGQGAKFGYFYNSAMIDGKRVSKRYFIKTPTSKMIEFSDDSAIQTGAVLNAIRERYDCKSVTFFIGTTSANDMNTFIRCNYGYDAYYNKSDSVRKYVREECKKNDIALLTDVPGRDMLFFTPTSKLKTFDGELQVNVADNAKKIAKEFSKHLTKKKTSRILLNEFIKIIA